MRVLLLSVSGGLGGAERVLLDLLGSLNVVLPAWTVGVLALEDGPLIEEVRSLGIEATVLALPSELAAIGERGLSPVSAIAGLSVNAPALHRFVRALAGHVAAWRPDIVHTNGVKAHVLAAWTTPKRCALIWHLHDYLSGRRLSPFLLRHWAARPSLIVANSESVATDCRTVLGADAPIVAIHNGIDVQRFSPGGPRIDLDVLAHLDPAPLETVRVGVVATFARWKGHEVFLNALARLPAALPVRGYIVGGPVYRTRGSQWSGDELSAEIGRLGLTGRVGLVPFQRRSDPVYRALDVVVHASTTPEPFGLSIVEAMACERAVVASQAGGAAEIVEAEVNALTHRPGDVDQLASQMERLCMDRRLRHRLAACARADVRRRFDRTRFAGAMAAAYLRAVRTIVEA